MKASNASASPTALPVTRSLSLVYVFSLVIALLMAIASVAGLVYSARFYETEALQQSYVANDVVNLFIGLPILLGAMWLARRGKLLGLLFWPGALFYVFYNATAYTFGLPLTIAFLLSLLQLTLSAYTTIALVASIDGEAVQQRLNGAVPERLVGGALVGAGLLFFLLAMSMLIEGMASNAPIVEGAYATSVADLCIVPAWIIGGVQLWQRKPLGYISGTGLLFQGSMLFIGLIVFFILQPLLTTAPFALMDTVVISIMSLIVFIPFALFLRGVVLQGERS